MDERKGEKKISEVVRDLKSTDGCMEGSAIDRSTGEGNRYTTNTGIFRQRSGEQRRGDRSER
jgi:hypothetical protein